MKRRKAVFGAVFEASISGNQALVLSKTDYLRLGARIAKYGRVVLMGRTYEAENNFKLDNLMVLRKLGLVSSETKTMER